MAADQELESEEAFKPLPYCTLGKIRVVKEYFLLSLPKVDSGMNTAFRVHILNEYKCRICLHLLCFFFLQENTNSVPRGGKPATR